MASEQLPSEFMPFGHVVGRVIRAVGDTVADPDADPEAIPVTGIGLVRFTPLELTRVVADTVPSTWVQQETIAADLDSDGFLSLAGARGLLLWPGAWKVSAGNASAFSFPAFTIEVTAAHTADAPLDLWTAAPYSPPSGATVTTLVVPAGAATGQILAWDGQRLMWVDAGSGGGGEPGEPGHSPVLTWQGDQIAVDGVVSGPHLTGPAGDPGDDGVTPATPQFTASASTLAAGSQATATVTGAYPSLNLALGIPRGADGTGGGGTGGGGSSLQIVGAGRPDVTTSMDAATQAAVASATVGTTFISTDGPQGAWVWMKRPMGWVATDGFSLRNLTAEALAPAILRVVRIGDVVSLIADWQSTFPGQNLDMPQAPTIWSVPKGFLPAFGNPITTLDSDGANVGAAVIWNGKFKVKGSSGPWRKVLFTWVTADPWPTTLPGTPAS